jgi:two-component system response regulator GlrR
LFLDEIAELTPPAQAALLQFLDEDKRFRRVGDPSLRRADVRVIAATHTDLTAQGRFRVDLFHRLNTLTVRVPGLDERKEDISLISAQLLQERAAKHQMAAIPISMAALRALTGMDWVGHIRQLAKALEVGLMRANLAGANVIDVEHLFPDRAGEVRPETWAEATRRFQAGFLRDVLEDVSWNVVAAAERLDLAKSHVYALIQSLGLSKPR